VQARRERPHQRGILTFAIRLIARPTEDGVREPYRKPAPGHILRRFEFLISVIPLLRQTRIIRRSKYGIEGLVPVQSNGDVGVVTPEAGPTTSVPAAMYASRASDRRALKKHQSPAAASRKHKYEQEA